VPAKLATIAGIVDSRFIHVSTDYVFDGQASEPYKTNSKPNPQTVYGKTKLAGEESVLAFPNTQVVRTSWLYGKGGNCFPKTIARKLLAGDALRVVDDQVGSPTSTLDLAEFLIRLGLSGGPNGSESILHGVSSGQASWFEFALSIAESLDLLDSATKPAGVNSFSELLSPTDTQSYPTPAKRPAFSVLEPSSVDGYQMPNWKVSWQAASKSVLESL
jgi:dTDP-4-dehydrorhamnose reductase